jgi:quercetin 2,3-dioxygenase
MKKEIKKIISASSHKMGEHKMYQPVPNHEVEQINPFLLLHHHGPHEFEPYNQGLPFGPHPHRGFETLTFIYDGEIEHADSQGFKSTIKAGGVQWMTAARGIVHSENLSEKQREHGGKMEIIQLWMNLPANKKMIPATYQGFQKDEIPEVVSEDNNIITKVISGNFKQITGPCHSVTGLQILNIEAKAGGTETYYVPQGWNILLYILDGEIRINGKLATAHQSPIFNSEGETIIIEAQTDGRMIICIGEPINEPMVAQGPFVMNSTTEILQAMRDYQMGKMGVM